MLKVRSIDPMSASGVQRALDFGWIGALMVRMRLLFLPVLNHHGDYSSAATVLFLLYKWDVQPNACALRQREAAEAHKKNELLRLKMRHQKFFSELQQ